ncbi:RND transporter, hydrophobe/amphiphile efflux-1 family protein, partial [Vibrio parahaemolyticus AQ3810]
QWVWLRKTRF